MPAAREVPSEEGAGGEKCRQLMERPRSGPQPLRNNHLANVCLALPTHLGLCSYDGEEGSQYPLFWSFWPTGRGQPVNLQVMVCNLKLVD